MPDSSFISGTTTKDDGTFILKQTKDKSCIIKISGLGYSPVYMQSTDSLANIKLQDITYNVGEVAVVGNPKSRFSPVVGVGYSFHDFRTKGLNNYHGLYVSIGYRF